MNGSISDDPYIQELDSAVKDARLNREWRSDYMIYSANYWDAVRDGRADGRRDGYKEGRAMGLEEGKAQGIVEGKAQGIAEMVWLLKESGKTVDEISSWCRLDPKDVLNILASEIKPVLS